MAEIDRVLVFDVWGDYAHFRRGYTTTSPLTYPFPSRTTLAGLISAILGLPRDSYYKLFGKDNSAFALQILNPIRKIKITQNLIDTKTGFYLWDNKGQRTQIPFEFIKKPKYRVYAWLSDQKFDDLIKLIKEHNSVYTPYLGISECIANFEIFGEGVFEVEKKRVDGGEGVEIYSIIEKGKAKVRGGERGKKYGIVKVPGFMNQDRSVSKYMEFYYEEDGKPLKITEGEYYTLKGEDVNVVFF
ncbi:MAG: type I-B CRISPR-associated protein Cas5 [Candidatus Desulfofervidus sp.]|nr:type I-B CRISPR-associated protein Cas5 [Candidatus Desulfofervidus sp.]